MHFRPSARIRRQAAAPKSAIIDAVDNNAAEIWYYDTGPRRMMLWIGVIFFAQVCTEFDAMLIGNFRKFYCVEEVIGNPNTSELSLIAAIDLVGTFCGSILARIIGNKLYILFLNVSMAMLIW